MNLLAFDTSTDACTVALQVKGEKLVHHEIAPQKHAQLLLPCIDALLASAGIKANELDAVVFGQGPGSFTGVRIAAAAAQGIAFGCDIGVIPISSLQCLAQSVFREHARSSVLATFDARMGEIYWGFFLADAKGLMQPSIHDQISPPDWSLIADAIGSNDVAVVGSGSDAYRETLVSSELIVKGENHIENQFPNAIDLLELAEPMAKSGKLLDAAEAIPVYIRDRVALTEQERAEKQQAQK